MKKLKFDKAKLEYEGISFKATYHTGVNLHGTVIEREVIVVAPDFNTLCDVAIRWNPPLALDRKRCSRVTVRRAGK